MAKLTIVLGGALVAAIITLALMARRQDESSRIVQQLQQQNETLRGEVETLREELARASAAQVPEPAPQVDFTELDRLRQAERELLRLRDEVTRLKQELKKVAPDATEGMVLKGKDRFETPESYQPPVEITLIAKTDSTNLRLAYAADQVIFNWELNESELRVDGGPASGQHLAGAGGIPVGEYVTIRWIVTPAGQEIFVNGELRFQHHGDYSQINRPVSVFPSHGSTVTISGFEVKRLGSN
jgi:hypothetical protein